MSRNDASTSWLFIGLSVSRFQISTCSSVNQVNVTVIQSTCITFFHDWRNHKSLNYIKMLCCPWRLSLLLSLAQVAHSDNITPCRASVPSPFQENWGFLSERHFQQQATVFQQQTPVKIFLTIYKVCSFSWTLQLLEHSLTFYPVTAIHSLGYVNNTSLCQAYM